MTSGPGFFQLVRDLVHDARMLVQDEVALFRTEVRQEASTGRRLVVLFAVVAITIQTALLAWCAAAVIALSSVVGVVWAAVTIAAALTVIGIAGAVILRLRMRELRPKQTIETLKENKRWLSTLRDRLRRKPAAGTSMRSAGTSSGAGSRSPAR
jgi:hypothetical protein